MHDIEKNIGDFLIDVDEFGKQLDIISDKSRELITAYKARMEEINTIDNNIIQKGCIVEYEDILTILLGVKHEIDNCEDDIEELDKYMKFLIKLSLF
ncbi:MAG: hypothetical protein LBQ94_07125 [Treponema sp.]|nr:hypothetical protein [Treponema sp.]